MLRLKDVGVACLLLLTPLIIFAQLGKGTNSLGLDGNLQNSKSFARYFVDNNGDSTKLFREADRYRFSVSYLRFVSDRLALGLGTSYAFSRNTAPISGDPGSRLFRENINREFQVQGQARYFFPITERLQLFAQGYLDVRGTSSLQKRDELGGGQALAENLNINMALGIDPGILYMVAKRWGIEGTVPGFQVSNSLLSNDSQNNLLSAVLDTNFSLGNIRLGWRFYF